MTSNEANDMLDAWALCANRAKDIVNNMDNNKLAGVDIDDATIK
jgi:hypothetical protein